jgi:histidyl-tRNA synthetase
MFSRKICFPEKQKFIVQGLKNYFDRVFPEAVDVHRKIILDEKVLKLVDNKDNLSQVYHFDHKVLRFDHTHGVLFDNDRSMFPERSFGAVFRNGARYPGRFREFLSYDMDYCYENYGLYPLIKLKTVFPESDFIVYVNDLSLLKKYLPNVLLHESNVKVIEQQLKLLNLESYYTQFWVKYPSLKGLVTIDPTLVRGWSYYTDLIFEISASKKPTMSVAGGGVYLDKDKKYIGFGVGLSRLIYVLQQLNLLDKYLRLQDRLLIIYQNKLPLNLLFACEKAQIPFYLYKGKGPVIKSYKKVQSKTLDTYTSIRSTIIVSDLEDSELEYYFKASPLEQKKKYSLDQLMTKIKETWTP